jgi:hypothetical protein
MVVERKNNTVKCHEVFMYIIQKMLVGAKDSQHMPLELSGQKTPFLPILFIELRN